MDINEINDRVILFEKMVDMNLVAIKVNLINGFINAALCDNIDRINAVIDICKEDLEKTSDDIYAKILAISKMEESYESEE